MNEGSNFNWATDPEERNHLWKARHDIIYACMALKPGSKPYSTDVCVPISNLPEVIVKTKKMIDEAGLIGKKKPTVPFSIHILILVVLITTTADDTLKYFFLFFRENKA